jgi:uncharacterized membrane protein YdfJ with MMPL/SSD domain
MFSPIIRLVTRYAPYIIVAAIIGVGVAGWYAGGVFKSLSTTSDFTTTSAQSIAVERIASGMSQGQSGSVLLFTPRVSHLTVTDPEYKAAVAQLLAPLAQRTGTRVISYLTTKQPSLISTDKTKTYATVSVSGTADQQYSYLTDYVAGLHSSVLTVSLGGTLVAQHQSSHQVETDLHTAELISLPLLAILLLVIFRGVIAALLPLILGVVSIVGAIAVVHVLTLFTSIDQYALNIVTIMGLGLSVDYSLLIVNRFREELTRQDTADAAIAATIATAGRTIFFSGLTVMVSLGALTIFPIGFLRSIGLGGIATLLVALIASLLLLPALLHVVGSRINKLSLGRPPKSDHHRGWAAFARFITTYPWIGLVIGVAVIGTLSWPLRQAQFAASDYHVLPVNSSARQVATSLATDFGNHGTAMTVLIQGAHPLTTLASLRTVADVTAVNPNGETPGKVTASVYTSQTNQTQTVTAIRNLNVAGYSFAVGGPSAELVDSMTVLSQYLPEAIAVVVLAMFVLLTFLLRSIILPIQAILINCLALAGSFGILVFIFQEGHFTSSHWLSNTGGLSPSILLLIFAIAFGLSMDYSAFLYSRIREEYDATRNNRQAIAHGLERTSGIITAAATLLFVVMAAFSSSKIAFLQQVGLGLAIAVLLDAFLVRIFLVPAVMRFIGQANWYAPKWLFRRKV